LLSVLVVVNAQNEALAGIAPGVIESELEAIFEVYYESVTRAIVTVIHDPGRAEELAVDVFLKWSRTQPAQGPNARGWLYRTAVRLALDELRRKARRDRYEGLLASFRKPPPPDSVLLEKQEQEKVRTVLRSVSSRQAELLLLRGQGLDYNELAAALHLNPGSVGTFLSRAQQAFRKEYVKRYGER
jgi:RNA polymerase sigma-70 factor (ECF subfamily)